MKTSCFLSQTLAVALLAFGVLTASAQVAVQLKGHVQEVDRQANRLIVKQTGTGDSFPLAVNQQTQIVTVANKLVTLEDLTVGDGVTATYSGGVASRIVVNPAPLTAIVRSIDPGAKKLVVVRPGTDAELAFVLADRAAIVTKGNAPLEVMALKPGDMVSITRDGEVVRRVEVFPKPQQITGHVKSVAGNYKTFVVTETGTKKDITVEVDDDTKIENTEGKPLAVKDLKEGDGVGIAHYASLAKSIVVNVRQ